MNLEFHYYAIRLLAQRAGFPEEEARVLATSSQYVDDSILALEVVDGLGPARPYRTLVTQNYLFWDESVSANVYLPFHFIPGNPEAAARQRRDGLGNPWIVTPDSPLAKGLLIDALRSRDLFRMGIALHAYADTWAHQNFSGRLEDCNALESGTRPLPPAGHLQALRRPDEATGLWRDERLLPSLGAVDNTQRFLGAAQKIYRYLRTYRGEAFEDEDLVLGELSELWTKDSRNLKDRIVDFCIVLETEAYDRHAWAREAGIEEGSEEEEASGGYDKLRWAKAELLRRTGLAEAYRPIASNGRFQGSKLHRWTEAALAHRRAALEAYSRAGLDLGGSPGRQTSEH